MNKIFIVTFVTLVMTINAMNGQATFVIVCNQNSQQLEVILAGKQSQSQKMIKDGFPNQHAAESFLNANRNTIVCGNIKSTNSNPPSAQSKKSSKATFSPSGNNNAVKKLFQSPLASIGSKPGEAINIEGLWYNDHNDCIAIFTYTGNSWVANVHQDSQSPHLQVGEVIAELYPTSKGKVKGRLKVLKKRGTFEWKEVEYKTKLTELKGKYNWKFYAPSN